MSGVGRPKAYIAGGMRGYKLFNFPAFDAAKDEVRAMGYHPISPADMDRVFEPGFDPYPPEDWKFNRHDATNMIMRDLEVIARQCEAIYMLRGWETSVGAILEKQLAEFLGLEIRYQEDEFVYGDEPPC